MADPVALSESAASPDVFYGMAGRGRWVTVPSWFLGLFTKENVPLSTWGAGFEVFRRKGDMDIVLGFSYQSMGPKDGNWLGKGKSASVDTDFVSFRNFAMIGVDASFIWHQAFNDFIGLRYGAGLGLGVITGDMLRISAGPFCTEDNAGDLSKCYPARGGDPAQPIRGEQALKDTENSPDGGPSNPHRFKEDSVPGAIPILNLTIGLDIRIPNVKGLEIRPLEFGFYNSFFVGGGIGYVF